MFIYKYVLLICLFFLINIKLILCKKLNKKDYCNLKCYYNYEIYLDECFEICIN